MFAKNFTRDKKNQGGQGGQLFFNNIIYNNIIYL